MAKGKVVTACGIKLLHHKQGNRSLSCSWWSENDLVNNGWNGVIPYMVKWNYPLPSEMVKWWNEVMHYIVK